MNTNVSSSTEFIESDGCMFRLAGILNKHYPALHRQISGCYIADAVILKKISNIAGLRIEPDDFDVNTPENSPKYFQHAEARRQKIVSKMCDKLIEIVNNPSVYYATYVMRYEL